MSFLTRYDMDDDACRRRQAFLGIADQDADNVQALRLVFAKMAREFAERFYQYLLAQPQTANCRKPCRPSLTLRVGAPARRVSEGRHGFSTKQACPPGMSVL